MADSLTNTFKNIVASELEKRGITANSSQTTQDVVVEGSIMPLSILPSDENQYVSDPNAQINPITPTPVSGNEEVQTFERAPLGTPDSATFSVEQTLIQPTLSSDVASVAVVISLDDIPDAMNYEVRWVTA